MECWASFGEAVSSTGVSGFKDDFLADDGSARRDVTVIGGAAAECSITPIVLVNSDYLFDCGIVSFTNSAVGPSPTWLGRNLGGVFQRSCVVGYGDGSLYLELALMGS